MEPNRKIRVLHVITRMIVGGAQENTLFTAALQTKNPRYEVTLLTGIDDGPEGDLHDTARAQGVNLEIEPLLVRPIRPITDLRAFFRLRRYMRDGKFDIVHTHSSKAGILGRMAARSAGVPIIVHTLHSLVFHEYEKAWKNTLYIALKKLCAPWTHSFISVNQKTLDGALAQGIGTPGKHIKIFSGMDLAPFLDVAASLSPAQAKAKAGIPETALVVGKVARLFPLKGHDLFMEAAAKVAAERPDVHFLLVGGGILREPLEAQARKLGIFDRVHFSGLVRPEQVPALIQAMDVVVHSSLREGIARVIPQAGAVGKPVVTFEMDGAPEVIQNGVSGYLAPPQDTTAMAKRVVELLASAPERERMGREGQKFARENYSAELMVDRINAVYEKLLASR
jgi:glycosyltransferase involved in cell wall biosynthesis